MACVLLVPGVAENEGQARLSDDDTQTLSEQQRTYYDPEFSCVNLAL